MSQDSVILNKSLNFAALIVKLSQYLSTVSIISSFSPA